MDGFRYSIGIDTFNNQKVRKGNYLSLTISPKRNVLFGLSILANTVEIPPNFSGTYIQKVSRKATLVRMNGTTREFPETTTVEGFRIQNGKMVGYDLHTQTLAIDPTLHKEYTLKIDFEGGAVNGKGVKGDFEIFEGEQGKKNEIEWKDPAKTTKFSIKITLKCTGDQVIDAPLWGAK